MKKEDKSEMLDFIMDVYKKDEYFFHYLLGWMANDHLENMVEAARIYQEKHTPRPITKKELANRIAEIANTSE